MTLWPGAPSTSRTTRPWRLTRRGCHAAQPGMCRRRGQTGAMLSCGTTKLRAKGETWATRQSETLQRRRNLSSSYGKAPACSIRWPPREVTSTRQASHTCPRAARGCSSRAGATTRCAATPALSHGGWAARSTIPSVATSTSSSRPRTPTLPPSSSRQILSSRAPRATFASTSRPMAA